MQNEPTHADRGKAPVRRTFLRFVRLLNEKSYGRAQSFHSFQMNWVTEKYRQGGFLASRQKIRKQTVLPCAKNLARYRTEVAHCHLWRDVGAQLHLGVCAYKHGVAKTRRSTTAENQDLSFCREVLATFFEIAKAYCSLIFSVNDVRGDCVHRLMKWNWPINEKGETCLFEVRFCSVTSLDHTQLH